MEKFSKYSTKFYLLLGGCAIGLAAGAFLVARKLFPNELESYEDRIELLKAALEKDGKLTQETMMDIMVLANLMTEEEFQKDNPDLDKTRLANFENKDLYEQFLSQTMQVKMDLSQRLTMQIMQEIGISENQLENAMRTLNKFDLEKRIGVAYRPKQNQEPSIETIRKAFIEIADLTMKKIDELQKKAMHLPPTTESQQMLMIESMFIKFVVDDEIQLKYGLNELEIKHYLFKYELDKEQIIKKKFIELSKLS